MTPRLRAKRVSGSFTGTGRAHFARGLESFWLRIRWWRNIRLRPRSREEKRSPSWNCKDRKGKSENRKIERARRVESCFRRDADRAALLYSPRSESQFKRGAWMKALKDSLSPARAG